ncbi:L-rhamnose mutarotase [Flagellimonas sp. CMM7]|uniref:L-rhamnose mutarotase n=1 Tax=Flagellimonas sp. CMM7 TaxID=2654676 RepID=UPI001969E48A|nr:L-rhamnose mutarotase [Flagellimonas sp. CMM7]UII79881.1 L-rhamnose mutarotase [Flagellimonas sp. CMM7]
MKTYFKTISLLFALFLLVSCNSTPNNAMNEKITKRVGMVIKLKPEHIEEYKKLHADSNPGVRDLLTKYGMRNFSIFLHEINGEYYEFGYYEYVGNDFEADMKKMGEEERTIAWLKVCDPMQTPLEGYKSWTEMERVYFNP